MTLARMRHAVSMYCLRGGATTYLLAFDVVCIYIYIYIYYLVVVVVVEVVVVVVVVAMTLKRLKSIPCSDAPVPRYLRSETLGDSSCSWRPQPTNQLVITII